LAINGEDMPLGQVRFDVNGAEAVISISLDAEYRGYGYGSRIIMSAAQKLFQTYQVQVIHAYIKQGNQASTRAFLKAGFLEDGNNLLGGEHAKHLILDQKRIL
jgi:RimJ/RimL family protein N-acetyltransferase